jgi:chromosome partitioning protein
MMIYSIASQKGGVGKSVTAITLSAYLARKGKRVLLVDVDAQANSSKAILKDYSTIPKAQTTYATILKRQLLPIHKTYLKNLFVAPSHILLSDTDLELTSAIDHREARLKTELDNIKDNYDYVFIDCPPALSWLTINALVASDKIIIVVSPGYFELDSLVQIAKTISDVRVMFNPSLHLEGFLFTMSDPTINAKTSLQILRQTYTDKVFKAVIPRNTDIRDALFNHKDIFEFNPTSPSAQAYTKLAIEIFNV